MPTLTEIIKARRLVPREQGGGSMFGMTGMSPKTLTNMVQETKIDTSKFQIPGFGQPMSKTLAKAPTTGPQQSGPGMSGGMAAGIIGGVSALGTDAIDSFSKGPQANTWGIEKQNDSATEGKSVLGGVASGASTGAVFGPWGAAIGGAVGGLMGLFKGKKQAKKDDKTYKDNTQMAYEDYNQKANAQQYAAMGKAGAKLAIMKKINGSKTNAISYKSRKFKVGGKLDKVGEVNVIPSGTLHKEKNNLGEKDKGLPIIDEKGNKKFEVEREELILRLSATKEVESRVEAFKKTHNVRHLIELGKFLTKEIMTNTHDNSGKFGLEAN